MRHDEPNRAAFPKLEDTDVICRISHLIRLYGHWECTHMYILGFMNNDNWPEENACPPPIPFTLVPPSFFLSVPLWEFFLANIDLGLLLWGFGPGSTVKRTATNVCKNTQLVKTQYILLDLIYSHCRVHRLSLFVLHSFSLFFFAEVHASNQISISQFRSTM